MSDESERRGAPGTIETREWLVGGRVQGVAFRAATRSRALELGLAGVAENLPDGRVRVLAEGDAGALDRLAAWLRRGPPHARVDALDRVDGTSGADPDIGDALVAGGFAIRRGREPEGGAGGPSGS